MKPVPPKAVTLAQWLAVAAVWALAAYGAFGAPTVDHQPVRLIACVK